MQNPGLKKIITGLLILGICVGTGFVAAQIAAMTKEIITIQTPEKKSEGDPTRTVFYHKKHVDEFGATCASCHPAIADVEGSPKNDQITVHETCRQCHAKNKPGKSFVCTKCHIK